MLNVRDFDAHRVERLPVLVLHAHSRCNCRCVMCDIWKNTASDDLTLERVTNLLPDLRELGVQNVVFTGGEPLMNPQLPAIAACLRGQGIRLTLLSAGLLLARFAGTVSDCLDEIILSLDGPEIVHDRIRRVPGAFRALQHGVAAVRKANAAIPVRARTTVQKANRLSLCQTVDSAKDLGLDSISFLAVDTASQAFNRELIWPTDAHGQFGLSIEDTEELTLEMEHLIAAYQAEINRHYISEDASKLRRIVSHFRAQLGLDIPVAPLCNAPWVSAVLELDGSIRPCFFHPPIARLSNGALRQAINSESAMEFRRNLDIATNPVCSRCVCSLNYREPALPESSELHSPVYSGGSPRLPAGGR